MTTSEPIATSATGPTKASRFANCPPNQFPAPASAAIQIVEPAAVQARNFAWFIFTMPAGSDTANLSVFGYDPKRYYSGRSPLEAASLGIDLAQTDATYRCNLVTLSGESDLADTTMVDYSAGEISTEEARELILFLEQKLGSEGIRLYPGFSYRHCLVLNHAQTFALAAQAAHPVTA